MRPSALAQRWSVASPPGALEEVEARYATPPRHYHTWGHVAEVCGHLADARFADPTATWIAAVWHDAVYVVGASDNEAQSAKAAEAWCDAHGLNKAAARAAHLIRLTAAHGRLDAADIDPDAARFLDADMAILAAPWERFLAYEAQVRAEWWPVVGIHYLPGRRSFLEGLLTGGPIYLSRWGLQREATARSNIERLLIGLTDEGVVT